MTQRRTISFDMDGTIIDLSFAESVWLEGIPQLFAIKNGVSIEDAKKHVKREYEKIGRKRLEWYDLNYWLTKFDLDISYEKLLGSFQDRIKLFPEVFKVLEKCTNEGFKLIIVTNARREFLNLELEKTKIGRFFERDFSSTSDFSLVKKTVHLYKKVCSTVGVSPSDLVHVGDDRCFDYDTPSRLGITAFYLDRNGKYSGDFIIHNLKELLEKVKY